MQRTVYCEGESDGDGNGDCDGHDDEDDDNKLANDNEVLQQTNQWEWGVYSADSELLLCELQELQLLPPPPQSLVQLVVKLTAF